MFTGLVLGRIPGELDSLFILWYWTRYLFYGADVTAEGLELFEDTLLKLLAMDLKLSGYFQFQGEDGEKTMIYRVIDNQVYQEESRILMGVK